MCYTPLTAAWVLLDAKSTCGDGSVNSRSAEGLNREGRVLRKPCINLNSIWMQIVIALAIHWLVGDVWTWEAVSSRLALNVPLALALVGSHNLWLERQRTT